MAEKFQSFRELLSFRRDCPLPALRCCEDGGPSALSYGELYELVMEKSAEYRAQPWGSVLHVADSTCESIVAMLAASIAGKTVIMADGRLDDKMLQRLCTLTRAQQCFCDAELDALLRPLLSPAEGHSVDGEGDLLFFTSGTCESSKAVVLSSRSLCYSAWNGQSLLPCGEGDVILSVLPLAHVFGFVCAMLWGFAYGACIALGRGLRYIAEDCALYKPTIISAVPSLAEFLMRLGAVNAELRTMLIGSAPCTEQLIEQYRAQGVSVRFGYGLTETASGVALSTSDEEPFAMTLCPDTEIRIAEDGEVLLKSSCMMRGYLGYPPAGEWLSTGDVGYLDDLNRLHISGRKKDILVLPSGNKIFCAEYESSLKALIGPWDVAVIQRDNAPTAVFSGDKDRDVCTEAFNEFNRTLPRELQLRAMEFRREPLPRTALGKLRRYEI